MRLHLPFECCTRAKTLTHMQLSTALTAEDIAAIDAAGKQGARQQTARTFIRRAVLACAVASVALGLAGALGIDIL